MKAMTRLTRQRQAIWAAFEKLGRPVLPAELLELAREEVPNLNLATVYRNLNALVEESAVVVVQLPGQPARFEIAGHHHHHFMCRSCERVFDVHACSSEITKLAPDGFSVEDHELTLYGKCPDCSSTGRARQ